VYLNANGVNAALYHCNSPNSPELEKQQKSDPASFRSPEISPLWGINSSPAIMPLAASYFGVIFYGGISPSKWELFPPFSHDTTFFKGTCLLIKLKEAKVALYGPHLHCEPGQ
jgi:hypothetical protein